MIRPSYTTGNVRNLDPGRVNCQTRATAPGARRMNSPPENLRNPARSRRAGLMRQFRPGQVYSMILASGASDLGFESRRSHKISTCFSTKVQGTGIRFKKVILKGFLRLDLYMAYSIRFQKVILKCLLRLEYNLDLY